MAFGARQGTFLATAAIALVASAPAIAQQRQFNVPAQDARTGIPEFARQAGVQISAPTGHLGTKRTNAVKGSKDVNSALAELIKGTGLTVASNDGRMIVLQFPSAVGNALAGAPNAGGEGPSSRGEDQAKTAPDEQVAPIVVTAQKRPERLLDVPVPVTALNAQQLISRGNVSIRDYYTEVPGLNLTVGIGGQDAPVLSIRGVTTGGTGFGGNPTVSVVVDDLPYGSSSSLGGGNLMPDLDPSDLAQIEVLRGPQGTLYGASSIGGLLKYVTADPSTTRVSGRLQAGINDIKNGDGLGYNVRGAVNLPVSDRIAVRASGFYRSDAGYIDDPRLNVRGVNAARSFGGRISSLARISDATSLKLSAVIQSSQADGQNAIHNSAGLTDLQQSYLLRGLGGYDRDSYIYSGILQTRLGSADIHSITGYAINKVRDSLDRTAAFGARTQAAFGVRGAAFVERFGTRKFSQELRASIPVTDFADWLIGGFYTRESTDFVQDIEAVDPANGRTVGLPYHNPFQSHYTEYAGFTDVTLRMGQRFDIQLGGRLSHNKQDLNALFEGVFIPVFFGFPSGTRYPETVSSDTSFTYLVTPRLKVTPDVMLYARFASGYRPGGPNANASSLGVPTSFAADTTQNYEVGLKGTALDRAITYELSAYYIDWKNIQLQLRDPVTTLAYFGNAGSARSKGLEFSAEVRPWRGMVTEGWVAWNDAALTDDLPPGPSFGRSGDRLPFSPRFSANLTADQFFDLSPGLRGYVGGTVSIVGDRLGTFTSTPTRQAFPRYTQFDLRAGARYNNWNFDLLAKNIGDKRGLLAGGLGTAQPFAFKIIEPRMIGLNASVSF